MSPSMLCQDFSRAGAGAGRPEPEQCFPRCEVRQARGGSGSGCTAPGPPTSLRTRLGAPVEGKRASCCRPSEPSTLLKRWIGASPQSQYRCPGTQPREDVTTRPMRQTRTLAMCLPARKRQTCQQPPGGRKTRKESPLEPQRAISHLPGKSPLHHLTRLISVHRQRGVSWGFPRPLT